MTVKPTPFFSAALYGRKTCYVYLPPGYEYSEQRYPVIYLLHGLYGSESDWTQKAAAAETLDRMIYASELRECIVVMPNDGGHAHGTFYADWYDGSGNFEQYIIDDLVPFIDETYRTMPDNRMRGIAGLSMGGYGAVMLALRHPGLFGAAVSLSGVLGSIAAIYQIDFDRSNFGQIFGPFRGPYAKQYDLHVLASLRMKDKHAGRPELYFNCGTADFLYSYNVEFNKYLSGIGYKHKYEEFPGEHTWEYWTEHLRDALLHFEKFFVRKSG
ncbi:alpha/beta hydrolase [Paenibacillus alkalitolerans]|uniref:alpha/beta hydrolase n=1 Tax=Paenibacillus alkalitolerans TaxID=2799335 RepID=UPI0018F3AF3E|nr:alpha/beta hydrolase family protein [Paenibacillus alkalitolerans]